MSRRALILIVFNCLLLINGITAGLFEHPYPYAWEQVAKTGPDTLKNQPDSLKNSVDTVAVDENGIDSEITYEAEDSLRSEPENKKVFLYGKAHVKYGDFELRAAYIEIDNKTNLVTAMGVMDSAGKLKDNPEFKDGQNEMSCEKIVYNIKTKKGKISGILTKQSDMFIHGEAVKKDSNNVMYIKNMRCIPCEFDDAKIYFKAGKAKVIPNDKIVTGPLFVEVMNIPTPLGVPFGYFPNVKNKSKAGILLPYYGTSAAQGFFIKNLGVFVPTGDKVQVGLFFDVYSNGSFGFNTQPTFPLLNYKVNYKYSGGFNFSFSRFITGIPENHILKDPNHSQHQDAFKITWNHNQDNKNNPTVRFTASVNLGSAIFNKYNNQSAAVYLNNSLTSNIMFSKIFKNSTLTFNARHNQNTSTRDIQIDAPGMMFAVNRMFPFKNEAHTTQNWLDKFYIDYTFQTQATIKTKDSLLFKPTTMDNIQYGMLHKIPIGTNISLFKYFTLSPQANFTGYTYFETTEKRWDSLTKTVQTFRHKAPGVAGDASFSANLSTKVYGDYVFSSRLIKQIRHQVIPTIGFTYHPNLEGSTYDFYRKVQADSLKRTYQTYSKFENGIYGYPSATESGNITFNINNTFDAKVRQKTDTSINYKKVALLQMLSLGGSYDVAAKKNNLSIINASARTSIIKNIVGLMSTATFDPYGLTKEKTRDTIFQYNKNKQLARFTGINFSVNTTLNNSQFKSMANTKLPWNVNVNYNLNLVKSANPLVTPDTKVQTLSLNMSFKPSVNWKFDVMTNYDFKNHSFSYTNIRIYRDLHCWEASINWVPFGFSKQYSISINLKTQALRDMKIPKQKQWFDNL